MAKKLTVNAVNSAAKKVMKERHLTDVNGEVWTVTVDEQMNPAYVANIAQDILVLMAKLKDENAIDDFDFEKNYNILLYPMILRYYTDLEITDKKTAVETINSYVNLMENLIRLGLVEQLMNCFDAEAMQKMMEKFGEVVIQMSEYVTAAIKEQAEKLEAEAEEAE